MQQYSSKSYYLIINPNEPNQSLVIPVDKMEEDFMTVKQFIELCNVYYKQKNILSLRVND